MKKGWKYAGFPILTLGLLVGCSGGAVGNVADDKGGSTKKEIPKEPIEVVFYTNQGDTQEGFDATYGNALRKKFPEYSIKFIGRVDKVNDLPDMIATKTHFDIYYASEGNFERNMLTYDLIYDMSDLIKKNNVDLNRYEPSIIEGLKATGDGKLFGLPVYTDLQVLFYSKDLFDKFGVPYLKDGMTWDQMIEASNKLTRADGETQYLGYVFWPSVFMSGNPLSIPLVDLKTNTPTINKDERWKTYFQKVYMEPYQVPGFQAYLSQNGNKIPDFWTFLRDKKAAMMVYVVGIIQSGADYLKTMSWDMVSLPSFKEQPGVGAQYTSFYFGVTKTAKNKDAATELIKYLGSDEFQAGFAKKGTLPVVTSKSVRDTLGQENQFKDKNWKAVYFNKVAPKAPKGLHDVTISETYRSVAPKLMLGQTDLNTALRQMEEAAQKKLTELSK